LSWSVGQSALLSGGADARVRRPRRRSCPAFHAGTGLYMGLGAPQGQGEHQVERDVSR
jgi:hypothetical protein